MFSPVGHTINRNTRSRMIDISSFVPWPLMDSIKLEETHRTRKIKRRCPPVIFVRNVRIFSLARSLSLSLSLHEMYGITDKKQRDDAHTSDTDILIYLKEIRGVYACVSGVIFRFLRSKMGNTESSSKHDAHVIPVQNSELPLAFELDEATVFKQILDAIPPAYREPITHLPPRPLIDIHRHHIKAICQLQKHQISAASHNEMYAVQRLKGLLPNHKNHYLFMEMYCVLSESLLKQNEIADALVASKNALELLLEYTPTDYQERSIVSNRLGQCYKAEHAWTDAITSLTQAIEYLRQCSSSNNESIASVQADIDLIK